MSRVALVVTMPLASFTFCRVRSTTSGFRLLCAALLQCVSIATHALASAPDPQVVEQPRRVAAVRTETPITIDGRLDEAAWSLAAPATDFYQQEPHEGHPSSERSEVRFLYDNDTLYMGGVFYDSIGERGLIINELKRDFTGRDGDVVALVLDPALDRRNAVTFLTNPGGAVSDAQAHNDGRQTNPDWNGVWFVRTGRVAGGWTAEMAIPFKTLRFPDRDLQVWGLNVLRIIRRKNEITVWSPVPRQFNELKVSYAGVLEGIQHVRPGRNLRVKPYVTAVAPGMASGPHGHADGGTDVKYGRGGLTWDLTYRSDFSQVEADEQQINLTRVSLFFPEKREFFLENQGAFQVGDQGGSAHDLVPFFSRRIGLSSQGQPVPVFGGARLTGMHGPYGVGVLVMSTDAPDTGQQQYIAARVSRAVGAGHSIGGSYFAREGAGGSNRVGEVDLHLALNHTTDVDAFVLKSETPGVDGRQWAGRAAVNVKENRHSTSVSYTNVGPGYRNDLGFVAREDAAVGTFEHEWNIRPRATARWVRQITVGGEGELVGDSDQRRLLSRVVRNDYSVELADGGRLGVDLNWNYERLTEPFEIAAGVMLGPGEYRFPNLAASYRSDRSRWLSGSVELTSGDFSSGTIRGVEGTARVRVNAHVAFSAAVEHNRIALSEGAFDTTVARGRLDWSLSTRMFLNALVQYNSASRARLANVRFNLIHHPLSDLFIVVNETRSASGTATRSVAVKFTRLVSF